MPSALGLLPEVVGRVLGILSVLDGQADKRAAGELLMVQAYSAGVEGQKKKSCGRPVL